VFAVSKPSRPISCTDPVVSKAEFTLSLMGKVQVLSHDENVALKPWWCMNMNSLRENLKPPEYELV
jgi:hypothetical protein